MDEAKKKTVKQNREETNEDITLGVEESGPEQEPGEGVYISMDDMEDLKKRIDAIKQEKDDMVALAQRVQADFDNFRKRNASVRSESLKEGARDAVEALIPVLDNFDRAVTASEEAGMDEKWLSGFQMVQRQMYETLGKLGLEEIPALDEAFDPNFHDAVMQEQVEGVEHGKVLEVMQKGYRMNDKLIRASLVKISG